MTTVFPGAIDAFPRPAANTKTNAAAGLNLSSVIDNLSDALEAVEAAVGATAGTNDALDYIHLHDGTNKSVLARLRDLVGESAIVNGNFDVWQRTAGAVVTSTTTFDRMTSFCADRIFVRPAGASVTQARSTTVPDARSKYSLAVTGAASVTTVDIGQRIRSAVVGSRLLGSLVFSCYVRNESGAAFTPRLRIGTPSAADNFGTVTNRLDQALQSCADAAWTRVHHVFDPSAYTDIANGMEVVLQIPSGSSVAGDVNRIAQFDLRPGSQYRGFVPPDPELELARCLPYFEKTFDQNTAVAQASGTTAGAIHYRISNTGVISWGVPWRFTAVKVKTPTMTAYSPSSANATWRNQAAGADSGTAGFSGTGTAATEVTNTQVAGDATVGSQMVVHATANAELT